MIYVYNVKPHKKTTFLNETESVSWVIPRYVDASMQTKAVSGKPCDCDVASCIYRDSMDVCELEGLIPLIR